MKQKKAIRLLIGITIVSAALLFFGCTTLDLNSVFLGKEDTSISWEMVELEKAPSMNKLEKLSNTSKEASAIYRYADRAHAEDNKWYKFIAAEKPGAEYYAYKAANGNMSKWEVYKKK
ncbi:MULTISPECIES: hypothetical protein [Treponema]|uniref:hypothetical protein n=1 Tax=Treponema TaxID=157 RepID=UPI000466976E|nr:MULTISPECIES: hypothetical protein [Treponema]QSI05218.1 glycosyltransferase [Treponema pedis]UTC84949.1 glycosyltransferase [Treponema denticola]UYT08852.1 glycosyltransferase [Treponema denticola]